MTNVNTDGLPDEMKQRIAEIIEKAKANVIQPVPDPAVQTTVKNPMTGSTYQLQGPPVTQQAPAAPPAAPIARPPSLMDHIIALRQEVDQLRHEVHATAQVTEAVGNAVGQMYAMFQQQTEPTSYSSAFQESQPSQVDDF